MISSGSVRSHRGVTAAAGLLAALATVVLVLAVSGMGKADDGQTRIGDRFAVLNSSAPPGIAVVDPDDMNSAAAREALRNATPANPVVFAGGPVDTRRIRRSASGRGSRGTSSHVRGTWVAPSANSGVCLLLTIGANKSVGGACSRPGAIDKGSIAVIFGNDNNGLAKGETVIAGAVPNGVTGVRVELIDGSTETAAVADNSFSFDTTVGIARYRFVTVGGPGESTPVAGDPHA